MGQEGETWLQENVAEDMALGTVKFFSYINEQGYFSSLFSSVAKQNEQ